MASREDAKTRSRGGVRPQHRPRIRGRLFLPDLFLIIIDNPPSLDDSNLRRFLPKPQTDASQGVTARLILNIRPEIIPVRPPDQANHKMSLWIDVLRLGAEGRSDEARFIIAREMSLSLCHYSTKGPSGYDGPLPKAVRSYAAKLNTVERNRLLANETEFIEIVLDDVLHGIVKRLILVEFCFANPNLDFDQLVARYPWWSGLKRNNTWKAAWIADHLRSFIARRIALPPAIVITLGERGEAKYDFNELAWAIAPNRFEKSWKKYLKHLGPLASSFAIVDDLAGMSVADESFDYGAISMAEVTSQLLAAPDLDLNLDLEKMAVTVSQDITNVLANLHLVDPRECYQPVAWHNVFWKIVDDFDGLPLELETKVPQIDSDVRMVEHLRTHYTELNPVTRLTLHRRRHRLTSLCHDAIFSALRQIFDLDREQKAIPIAQ